MKNIVKTICSDISISDMLYSAINVIRTSYKVDGLCINFVVKCSTGNI